jgi:hypothetical protein
MLARTLASNSELKAVGFILEREWPDGTSTETVARAVVKALDEIRLAEIKPIAPPLRPGLVFQSQLSSKNLFVVWIGDEGGDEMAWIVAEDSNYGWLGPVDSPFWDWSSVVKSRQNIIDRVLTNEIGMVAGDKVTLRQDGQYTVEASFKRGVLLRERRSGRLWAEENTNIKAWYRDGWS